MKENDRIERLYSLKRKMNGLVEIIDQNEKFYNECVLNTSVKIVNNKSTLSPSIPGNEILFFIKKYTDNLKEELKEVENKIGKIHDEVYTDVVTDFLSNHTIEHIQQVKEEICQK